MPRLVVLTRARDLRKVHFNPDHILSLEERWSHSVSRWETEVTLCTGERFLAVETQLDIIAAIPGMVLLEVGDEEDCDVTGTSPDQDHGR